MHIHPVLHRTFRGTFRRGILATLAFVGPAALVAAQDEKLLRKPFDQFDQDKDGVVQEKEFPGNPALFAMMDKNHDKRVTFDEYKVSLLARRYLAAVKVDRDEPRKRASAGDLAHRRLQNLARFDRNKDGKIQKSEWTGDPGAFTSLDLDGNGVIDKRDRAQARAEAEVLDRSLNKLPLVKAKLPDVRPALERFDKDKDSLLSRAEAARSPFAEVFRYADTSGDGQLDRGELDRVIKAVNERLTKRDLGYARPRAPDIPFSAWDKNNDGRVDLKEWVDKKYLFRLMDANRDAAVTKDEVLRFKKSFEGENFIERFDLNGDNRVTREEFAGSQAAFDRADRNGDGVISNRDR